MSSGSQGAPKSRRLAERIKEIVSSQLPRLKDPRVGFVTITDVRMSRDNDRATIFYTVLPDTPDQREATAAGLASATGVLRRDVGRVLTVRHTPELEFKVDDVADSGRRIEEILHSIAEEDQARGGAPAGDGAPAAEDEPASDDGGAPA